jgi:two-component system C4-dicarboxylate transport sensor histidine kinase DctB
VNSVRKFLILIALLLSVLASVWAPQQAYDWSLTGLKAEGQDRLLNTIIGLREAIDSYRYLPFLISQNRDVQELLLYPVLDKGAEVSRLLEQLNLISGATALMVLDEDGRALSYSRWREEQAFFLRSHEQTSYFIAARNGEQGVYVEHDADTGLTAIYLSAPIYDASRFRGVAVVRIDLAQLQIKLNQQERYLLIGKGEQVMLSSRAAWRGKAWSSLVNREKRLSLKDGTELTLLSLKTGEQIVFQSVELPDLGWQVATFSDTQGAQRTRTTAALIGLGGCLSLGLLLLFFRERKLKKLSRQETRDVVARSERQQRDIINNAHVGMIVLNPAGEIRFINPMACQQFGVGSERILNQSVRSLIAGDSEQFAPLQHTLAQLGSIGFVPLTAQEAVGKRADGSHFPMLISIKQMASQPSQLYLVTVIDITKRKRLEAALQQANDQLEQKVLARTRALQEAQQELVQAEKMAALGRMSSAVVHELNQPLTAIRTYLAICRHLLGSDQPLLAENMQLIDELTQRMASITQQLKVFAFKKPEKLHPVQPALVLEQSLLLFRERFSTQGLELVTNIEEPALEVAADRARLEQVFINLIKNACDALSAQAESGVLQISIARLQGDKAGCVSIMVCDNGPGVAEEHLTHLFDPFFTTKEIGDGLGLGLSIVHSIVQDLGGEIRVRNRVEGGACFEVILPAYQAEAMVEDN